MNLDTEIEIEALPLFRAYKSGRIERLLGNEVVPASVDPATAVASKDVVIDPDTGLSARLYLPDAPTNQRLPILVYFHGGVFIIESAFSPTYHNYLNPLAAKAGVLVVSVDYRRAPEHPLPVAYHDSWAALRWVVAGGDPWLAERADFGKLFLAGDSAGGNIAHHMVMRAGAEGVGIRGIALIHPFFSGGSEPAGSARKERGEAIWRYVCPGTTGLDDPLADPLAAGPQSLAAMACRRVVVFLAEKDVLRARGKRYYDGLVAEESGWGGEAELVVAEGEPHVFHLFKPTCEKAVEMMEQLVAFFKRE